MWKMGNLFALCFSCVSDNLVLSTAPSLSIYHFFMCLLQQWIDLTAYTIMPSTLIINAHRMNAVCGRFIVLVFKIEQNILWVRTLNPLNAELNPICHSLALLGVHFLHVSRIRVKSLTLRLLMTHTHTHTHTYIYMEHPFLMFLDHTQRRTSR